MKVWKAITHDGDLGLLVLFFVSGLIPALADAHAGRALGGEATVGAIASLCSGWAMVGRISLHHRAAALRRQLSARG
jgi:hypothetical protein